MNVPPHTQAAEARLDQQFAAIERKLDEAEATLNDFRRHHRENYEAFTAMRNDINEIIGQMISQEATLADGPEMAHECAAVAEAVRNYASRAEREALETAAKVARDEFARCVREAKGTTGEECAKWMHSAGTASEIADALLTLSRTATKNPPPRG